jgi:hypothetical protein
LVISTKDTYIHYISLCWVGKTHDYGLLKEEFPPRLNWFIDKHIRVDLGYLGIAKDYRCKMLTIPHKKPHKKELTAKQKKENTSYAKERIYVEHSIGGMKRYRILSNRLRVHDFAFYDDVLEVCSGLWNFYITN